MNLKETLDKLVEEGWLVSQVHPSLDLTIYNYSQQTQFERHWTEHTLMCRGLVLNSVGDIVGRPFRKFFNYEEVMDQVPVGVPYEISEKVDGSMGIFFWYLGHPVFASRGSFTSDQCVKGWKMLQKLPYESLSNKHTYIFEIIYPENRIVIDYAGEEKLVLLAGINTISGCEIPRKNMEELLGAFFELVKVYHIKGSWDQLKSLNEPNKEGFVIAFINGFRMKIKFEEYFRLHRILTKVSNLDIWERLMKGVPITDLLEDIPDELYDWVHKTIADLTKEFMKIKLEYLEIFEKLLENPQSKTKKGFAELALKYPHSEILFSIYEDKNYNEHIWKMIRPVWSKPFSELTQHLKHKRT